jgi:glycine/D-amino acid oxidase-like deaminating enzyme
VRVAVVGAGIAGLAVVWHLLQKGCDVAVFDRGDGASSVSTGLLHPFPGKEAVRGWRADEGMAATKELLQVASRERPVFVENGILRFAVTDRQREEFPERSTKWVPEAVDTAAMWIPDGITVFSRLYLEGLWKACKGVKREQGTVSLEELDGYDRVVLAAGADTMRFAVCKDLPLKRTIGQSLICRWPEKIPISLLSQGHITPTEDPELCQVGSTYEHTPEPDPKKALALLDKCALFYPPAKNFEVVEIRSGVRISPKVGYRPLVAQVAPKIWVFTGLGSRGLLYHALLAKELVDEL